MALSVVSLRLALASHVLPGVFLSPGNSGPLEMSAGDLAPRHSCGVLADVAGRIDSGLTADRAFIYACACTEVSGVENIGQCGRLSRLSWLFGAL